MHRRRLLLQRCVNEYLGRKQHSECHQVAARSMGLGLGMALELMDAGKVFRFSMRVYTAEVLFELGRRAWRVLARVSRLSLSDQDLSGAYSLAER